MIPRAWYEGREERPAASLVSLFHRVNSLLPDDQRIIWVRSDVPVLEALEVMEERGFSQLPVVAGETVIGVFSYRSFARCVAQLGKVDMHKLQVDECVEELGFFHVTDEIEELFDRLGRDGAVLVGGPDRLIAVATSTDVIRYLYSVTHPFVLIQEIETVLRGLVRVTVRPPERRTYIERAIAQKYKDRPGQLPQTLTDLDLGELVQVVINRNNYSKAFWEVMGKNRDSTRGYLHPIPGLRNVVFHFRQRLTTEEYRTLMSTRLWLLRKAMAAEARSSDKNG